MANLNDHSSREHALLSASSAYRWLACPPSAVAAEAYPDNGSKYAAEGTLAHEVAELFARCRLNGDWQIQPDTKESLAKRRGADAQMLSCAQGYADYIEEQIKQDGALTLLEVRVDYSPWVPGGFGTCDCVILQGDTMTVIDYKYGQGVQVSAEANPQLRLYALGALNDYGFAFDVKHIEMHIYQPRLNNVSVDSISAADLLDWAENTVKPTALLASKGEGEYCAGDNCRFCPHAGRCRELTNACTAYVEAHDLRVAFPVLAPHEVAEVLKMEPLISLWLKRVREQALATLLDGGEVPGYKAVEGRGSRAWVDELRVAETLKDAGYGISDITETKLLSVAQMEKSIGKQKANELLSSLIEKRAGSPTVAPVNDKRPAYDRLAVAREDFA